MENTLENKVKFFPLYYGRKALHRNHEYEVCGETLWDLSRDDKFNDKLLLKPLTKITDYDLQGIYYYGVKEFSRYYGNGNLKFAINRFLTQMLPGNADLLRYRGFAIPWCGLSVEKQIEYGWIKLI